jgi:ABC-2 type transport system ATP-binding protein
MPADGGLPRMTDIREREQTSSPLVMAEGIVVSIGGRPVLDGVDLSLPPATIFVLLGENGAGKTTLMRTLCGRVAPSRGRVRVAGRDPRLSPIARRAIGYVPQSIALYPELTVRENLAAFAAYADRGRAATRSPQAIMATLGLEAVADRRVGQLSGGYQRRVNLGAALRASPDLLVLDEPTVGLDRDAKAVLLDAVRGEARRGAAVLLTTHDLEAAAAMADRIGVLARGRIVAEGEPQTLLAQTFGERLVVSYRPVAPAGAELTERLAACGLRFSTSDGSWRSPPRGAGAEAVTVLTEAVASHGSDLQHLAIARPGLKELYDAMVQESAER